MGEIESLETILLSKWDGNNEDDAGSLWVGGGNSSGLEMSLQGFSLKQLPSPTFSHFELNISGGAWVFAAECGRAVCSNTFVHCYMKASIKK